MRSAEWRSTWSGLLADPAVRARYLAKVVQVPGSDCWWWVGAISGRGHGRFWAGRDQVVIAHRYAFGLAAGVDALGDAVLLGHRCDNPLCQRVDDGHIVVSSARANRREWAARRDLAASPLADPRGSRARAEILRSLARVDPLAVRDEIERVAASLPEQLVLF